MVSFLDAKSVAGSSSGGCCSMDVPCDISGAQRQSLAHSCHSCKCSLEQKGPTKAQHFDVFCNAAGCFHILPLDTGFCHLLPFLVSHVCYWRMEPICIFSCCTLVSVLLGNKASTLFLSACFTTNERNLKNP